MAPPLIFTFSGSRSSSLITARLWLAKASFNSIKSIWFLSRPACFNTLGTAATGPMPMMRGSTPALAQATNLAMGCRFSSFTIASLITTTKAAPSLVCELLPAVTLPPAANTGFNLANASGLVSRRGPSSVSTTYDFTARFPFSFTYTSSTVMGIIPSLK